VRPAAFSDRETQAQRAFLTRQGRLTVGQCRGRKRAIGTRRPMVTPLAPNRRWSLDFICDQLTEVGASASWRWSTTALANA